MQSPGGGTFTEGSAAAAFEFTVPVIWAAAVLLSAAEMTRHVHPSGKKCVI
jgi:hypothetical protein